MSDPARKLVGMLNIPLSALSSPDLTDDLRTKALARTRDTLKKLDEMRRNLELPADQLPIVIDLYGQHAIALIAEKQREDVDARTKRLPLSIRSEDSLGQPVKIPPGAVIQLITRPPWMSFRVEDISIHGDRTRWIIEDIKIGNQTQMAGRRRPIPGAEFGPDGVCKSMRFETCQVAMDFTIELRYVGPEPDGEVFEATAVGLAFE